MASTVVNRGKRAARPQKRQLAKHRDLVRLGEPAGTPPVVAAIRRMIGFSQPEFGRLVGYSTRAVAEWEAGKPMDSRARRRITEIHRLLAALSQLMPPDEVGPWLRERNKAFGGRPPMHLVEEGELDRLWQMIHQIDANVAN